MPLTFEERARAVLLETGRSTRCLRGRGLTGELRRVFYPSYNFNDTRARLPAPAGRAAGGAEAGLRRGRLVDAEISRWAHEGTPVKHPFARKFVKLCEAQRWTPVASQVVVDDEIYGVSTLADVVVCTARRKLLVLEVKVGFSGYHAVGSGRLQSPFEKYSDSPRNQHLLQLGFTVAMFKRTFPTFTRSTKGLLVRLVDQGIEVTTMDEALARKIPSAGRKMRESHPGR